MTKQEFVRFLKMEAAEEKDNKDAFECLCMLIEQALMSYPASLEIETDKGLKDVWAKMREYASKNKSGGMGCCPPSKAVEFALEAFGICNTEGKAGNAGTKAKAESLDLDDLLA